MQSMALYTQIKYIDLLYMQNFEILSKKSSQFCLFV